MKLRIKFLLPALGLGLFLSAPLMAGPTVIYVHGFNFGVKQSQTVACHGKSSCSSYWSTQDTSNPVIHVGYDGRYNPLEFGSTRGVTRMLQVLNSHCRRDQGKSCRVVNHSMGGLITGYVVANYNRSNTYNIQYVSSIVSAEGGSELANIGDPILRTLNAFTLGLADFLLSFPSAVRILRTSAARSAYDHNRNNGVSFYHIAGNTPFPWYLHPLNWVFPGKHDSVVAMHTTCSYRNIKGFSRCGGETITTGALWWKKKTTYSTHTGHKAHPRHSRYGVGVKHTVFPSKAAYTHSSL
jgi:hypothetical protein